MILNSSKKKKDGITLKIKGAKITSRLKIEKQTSFETSRIVFIIQAHLIWLHISIYYQRK